MKAASSWTGFRCTLTAKCLGPAQCPHTLTGLQQIRFPCSIWPCLVYLFILQSRDLMFSRILVTSSCHFCSLSQPPGRWEHATTTSPKPCDEHPSLELVRDKAVCSYSNKFGVPPLHQDNDFLSHSNILPLGSPLPKSLFRPRPTLTRQKSSRNLH